MNTNSSEKQFYSLNTNYKPYKLKATMVTRNVSTNIIHKQFSLLKKNSRMSSNSTPI